MDPVSVVVTAIALGAAEGLKPTVENVIRDAYAGLKALLLRKYAARDDTLKALADVEKKPESDGRKRTLEEELGAAGVGGEQEVLDKATELLKLLETKSPGATGGLVGQIDAAGGKVLVIGTNHGRITM